VVWQAGTTIDAKRHPAGGARPAVGDTLLTAPPHSYSPHAGAVRPAGTKVNVKLGRKS
jgi:hypothetical protein